MGTAERRLEILKYLCKHRFATMPELANEFCVSIRTIQRDIYELEGVMKIPIDVKRGKHDGGIYVIGDYSFDRMYMEYRETELLSKVKELVFSSLPDEELLLLDNIIKKYKKLK